MMKYYFVINPMAGRGEARKLIPEIEAVCQVAGINYEIHETISPADCENFVRQTCQEHRTESIDCGPNSESCSIDRTLRFYACGGDGTLSDVVNGAAGYDFAEVGCIPAGTGNDFIRNFPGRRFDDLVSQIRGQACLCDLIRYETVSDGKDVSRYCVNMFNIGFDSNVVDMTARMKRLPMVTGALAYLASIATMLIEKKGADLRVEYTAAEDAPTFVYDGKLLLIAVANGCFCGGGLKGIPRAVVDDGLFDVSLIRNVPRHVFIRLFPKYMKGKHLEEERLRDVIRYTHEKQLRITPNRGSMKLCVDGEITKAGPASFWICPKAFRFVLPQAEQEKPDPVICEKL